MGVAGMVLGIIAVIFAFIPVFGAFIAFPCLVVGLPLSGVAIYQGRKRGTGIGMAVAGLTTCIVALVITVVWVAVIAVGLSASEPALRLN